MGSGTAFDVSDSEHDLEAILSLLSSTHGLDFTHFRRSTLIRRIRRRMERSKSPNMEAYLRFMMEGPAEIAALSRDILLNVTPFFRDPKAFEVLKAEVYPTLCVARPKSSPIRVWVPSCGSGEEAYSLAITLLEALSEWHLTIPIQIFGTDMSESLIAKARAGVYDADSAGQVSKTRRDRFFTSYGSLCQISRRIQEMCTFAKQNIMADPPFSRLDLISSRNVLLGAEPAILQRILPIFHYALKPTGFLMLGAPSMGSDLFATIDERHGIYAKIEHGEAPVAAFPHSNRKMRSERPRLMMEVVQEIEKSRESMQALVEEQAATNADLLATNEDLVTSNEDLQSINEELQASMEELRATSHDLTLMNEMLGRRDDDLSRLTRELTGVLASLELPIVTLSRDLRIRCLSPEAKRALELTPADVGRALGDLDLKLDVPDLARLAAEVLDMGVRREQEVKVGEGRSYSLRILPYRTEGGRIEGVVLLFVDFNSGTVNNTNRESDDGERAILSRSFPVRTPQQKL